MPGGGRREEDEEGMGAAMVWSAWFPPRRSGAEQPAGGAAVVRRRSLGSIIWRGTESTVLSVEDMRRRSILYTQSPPALYVPLVSCPSRVTAGCSRPDSVDGGVKN